MQRLYPWLPLFLFLFALLVRLVFVAFSQFDGLYGQDPFAYFNYALSLRAALAAGQPPPPFFWPIGYPMLILFAAVFIGPHPAAGQLVSLLTGAAIAPLVYLLVLEYGREPPSAPRGALTAGLLAAVAAQLLLSSLSVMADAPALLWATLSALSMIRYLRRLSWQWLALTAVLLAFAILTRWIYALLILPWGFGALLAWRAARIPLRQMVVASAIAVAIVGSIFGLHFAADLSRSELSYVGDLAVYSWNPANALQKEMLNADGRFHYEYATGHFYARPTFHPAYIFPLFVPFWLIGLWAMRRQKPALAVLLVGWPLIVYLFLAGVPWQNWRFPLTFFPPLLVLVGLGVDWVWAWLAIRWRPLLLAYCLVALLGSVFWAVRDVGAFTAWANQSKQMTLDAGRQIPATATLLAFGLTATMQHYTAIDTRELFSLTEQDLQEIMTGETAVYLLINPDNIQTQWAGKSPAQNLAWLQTHTRLTPLAQYDDFVLYQVAP